MVSCIDALTITGLSDGYSPIPCRSVINVDCANQRTFFFSDTYKLYFSSRHSYFNTAFNNHVVAVATRKLSMVFENSLPPYCSDRFVRHAVFVSVDIDNWCNNIRIYIVSVTAFSRVIILDIVNNHFCNRQHELFRPPDRPYRFAVQLRTDVSLCRVLGQLFDIPWVLPSS